MRYDGVKNQDFDICVYDNVYYQEAVANGSEFGITDKILTYNELLMKYNVSINDDSM